MSISPAANTTQTPTLAHYPTVYYDRISLDRLEQMIHDAKDHQVQDTQGAALEASPNTAA